MIFEGLREEMAVLDRDMRLLWARVFCGALIVAGVILIGCTIAFAQTGAPNDCSGSVDASAATVSFPKSGATGPTFPSQYVTIQNIHATQTLWVNPMPSGTAAASTAGSYQIGPGQSISWANPQYPPPSRISVIGSGSSTIYTCAYR